MPPAEAHVRREIVALLTRRASRIRGLVWVIAASGPEAAAIRAVATSCSVALRRRYPTFMAADLRGALKWLLALLGGSGAPRRARAPDPGDRGPGRDALTTVKPGSNGATASALSPLTAVAAGDYPGRLNTMRSALRLIVFVALATSLFGCAAVAPWERAALSKKKMTMDPDGLAVSMEQHVFEYREGATGGYGSIGGGCGCN